jgi:hypothetical protein
VEAPIAMTILSSGRISAPIFFPDGVDFILSFATDAIFIL